MQRSQSREVIQEETELYCMYRGYENQVDKEANAFESNQILRV